MPKRAKRDAAQPVDATNATTRKQERRAARKRAGLEAQLTGADKVIAKRTAQLVAATARRESLAGRIARLNDRVEAGAAAGDAAPALTAYCMKERIRVTMSDPRAVVLANGRQAVAGTCPQCGSRVMRIGSI